MNDNKNTILTPAERRAEKKKQALEAKKRKKEVKRLRDEHKKRARVTPNEERPLICTPDASEMSKAAVTVGIILRALVAAVAAFGVTLLLCDALKFTPEDGLGINLWLLAALSFLFSAAVAAICAGNLPIKLGGFAAFGAILTYSFMLPSPVRVYHAIILAYNSILDRLVSVGFLTMSLHRLPTPASALSPDELAFTFAMLFAVLASLVYVPSVIRKMRLWPPLIFTVGVLVPIFSFNFTRGNWGVSLVIASVAAMTVMLACDKRYIKLPKKGVYDESITLSIPNGEPPIPEKLASKKKTAKERKEERRAERERRRKEKAEATVSLDDELADYFGSSDRRTKKKQPAKASRSASEKKLERSKLKAYLKHKRRVRNAKSAAGGFAGAAALLLAVLILAVPASTVSGRFAPIDSIDRTLQHYRDYFTALLIGNSPALDFLAYEDEKSMFEPRDTEAKPLSYDKIPFMRVYNSTGYNIYLRDWLGVNYADGKWHTVNSADALFAEYRNLFGTDYDPAETVKRNFYTYFSPKLLEVDGKYPAINSKMGVAFTKIGIKRYNLSTMNLYLPTYSLREFNPKVEIRKKTYSTLAPLAGEEASNTTYANYFDGIYTSYAMRESNESFSTVAILTNMRVPSFAETLAANIASFNSFRQVVKNGARNLVGSEYPYLVTLPDGNKIRYKTYTDGNTKYLAVTDADLVHTYHRNENGKIVSSKNAPALPKELEYLEFMTYAERAYYDEMFKAIDEYTVFVNSAYKTPSQSPIFAELLSKIAAENGINIQTAARANAYHINHASLVDAITESSVYFERHRLTMAIIDYLVNNYTYTLDPTVTESETFGVEKFLTETKEGYCVQFASALTLLMRQAGIPARYNEGYIASNFERTQNENGAYYADVYDENKHAWVEVWYDGVGWIPYEATPVYYDSAYKPTYTPGTSTAPETDKPELDPDEPSEPETPDVTDEEEQNDTPAVQDNSAEQKAARRKFIIKVILITLLSLSLFTVFFLIIYTVVRRAKRAAAERRRLLDKLAHAADQNAVPPTREEVRAVADMLFLLLDECGLAPTAGQFGDDLAAMLSENLDGILSKAVREEGLTEFQAERARLGERELKRVFSAIAAEEFGYGAPIDDVHLIARLYRRLYTHLYCKKVSVFRRAWLYFIRKKI
jgi:transglutaminase-like putative cysteine protease